MANLPQCPNVAQGACARSDLRLAGESDKFWAFICHTCALEWMVSKPRTVKEAHWDNEVKRMAIATAEDRARSKRPSYFSAPRGGWVS